VKVTAFQGGERHTQRSPRYVEAVDPAAWICADASGTPDVDEGRRRDKFVEISAERSHEHTKKTDQRSDISGVHIFASDSVAH